MRIQNNITAMNTHRMYTANNNSISKSAEKLSSGYRINRAGDDAAGLAISEKMRSQIRGLNMASKNSQDANSLIQTAEGALQEVHSMLQRMNELANQSATGTNENFDRSQISAEFDQLKEEINDISTQTNFNNMKLLDGSLASGASKVEVDVASTLQNGKTLSGTTVTNNGKYTVTNHTGLSSQSGTYAITTVAGSTTKINVAFTDAKTGDVKNTEIDLAKVTSNPLDKDDASPVADGKSFELDLSAAGLGTYTVSGSNGGGAGSSVADLATALAGKDVKTYSAKATDQSLTAPPDSTGNLAASTAAGAEHGAITVAITSADNLAGLLVNSSLEPGEYEFSFEKDTSDATGATINLVATNTETPSKKAVLASHTFAALATNDALGATDFGGKGSFTVAATKAANTASDDVETKATSLVAALNGAKFTGSAKLESAVEEGVQGGLKIQVGANENEQLTISVEKMNVEGLGLTTSKISDQTSAGKAITSTQKAINTVSEQRATLGAMQNRLEHKISNLDNTSENLSASESRIRDVDIAKEMTAFTKNQILSQAATAMLAQANSMPQNVLSLLQ